MTPLVTIGITGYNAQDTIERAVLSALAQDWRPLEVVVVDDASTDATWSILEEQAAAHPEMRIFRQEINLGVAAARNRIVSEAEGEFIAFFDDDDESAPGRVSAQIERLMLYEREFADSAPVVCHCARKVVYSPHVARIERTMGETAGVRAPSGDAVARRILLGVPLADGYGALPTCSQLARRSTYRAVGGFDEAFRRSEDTDFAIGLARKGGHFVGVPTPLVTQFMTRTAEKSLEDEYRHFRRLIEKHKQVFWSEREYRFAHAWLDMKEHWLSGRTISFLLSAAALGLQDPGLAAQRARAAAANFKLNRAFQRFHRLEA